MTLEQETDWFEQAAVDDAGSFTIYERATGRPIGNADCATSTTATGARGVGILIGEADARGRATARRRCGSSLDYAFTALGLHNVMLTVFEYNLAGRRCYEKAGFREIGRRRQSRWLNGRFWDEIQMDILSTEFTSPVLRASSCRTSARGGRRGVGKETAKRDVSRES